MFVLVSLPVLLPLSPDSRGSGELRRAVRQNVSPRGLVLTGRTSTYRYCSAFLVMLNSIIINYHCDDMSHVAAVLINYDRIEHYYGRKFKAA